MYACLSGVKPRCALTPACQKTNPKGLCSHIIESMSDLVRNPLQNRLVQTKLMSHSNQFFNAALPQTIYRNQHTLRMQLKR